MAVFQKMQLFFKNVLRSALNGSDGTSYATCAEAIADSADPHKVRGEIALADDVSALADLEGAGIVFDTTKNEYKIVDSEALMRRVQTGALLAEEKSPKHSLVDGNYLYVTHAVSPGVISKWSLPDLAFVGQLRLPEGEDTPQGIVKYGADIFVACSAPTTLIGILVKINIETFERVSALSLGSGEYGPTALVVYGTDVFVACYDGSNTAVIVRTAEGTQRLSALTLDVNERFPTAMLVYGTDIFVACTRADNVPQLVRVANGTSRTSVLTISGASELYPTALLLYGTDIFVACRNVSGTAIIVKTAGGLTRTSALTLNAGETFPTAMVLYGTDIFVACGTTQAYLVKTAGGTTRTSNLTLDTSERYPVTADLYGTDIFVVCSDTNQIGILVETAGGTTRTDAIGMSAGESTPKDAVVYGGNVFVACKQINNIGVLVRLSLDFERLSALPLNAGELNPEALVVYGGDIFVACHNGSNVGVLVQTAGGLTRTDAVTFNAGELFPTALVVYGTDIFVACRNGSNVGVLVRVYAGTSRTSALPLGASEYWPYALVVYGTDIFVACLNGTNIGVLVRTDGGLTRTSALTLNTNEHVPTALAVYGTDIFVACRDSATAKAVIVRTAGGLTRTSALTLNAGELYPVSLSVIKSRIYVLCRNTLNVGVVVTTRGGTVREGSFTLNDAEEYPARMTTHSDRLITVTRDFTVGNARGDVQYLDPLPNFTTFERLQDIDVGDSFKVRAGLFCDAEDPDRPVFYAADGHLAKPFKGKEGTEVNIYAHLPNYVEDGGFESGVFAPAWEAGPNWSIDDTNNLEGKYSAKWDALASSTLEQYYFKRIYKGKTYKLVFKAKTLTGNPSGPILLLYMRHRGTGEGIGDFNSFISGITTTATWIEIEIVATATVDSWYITLSPSMTYKGAATGLVIDEFYFYEKSTVDSIIIGRHNWQGKWSAQLYALYLSPLRSTAAIDPNNQVLIGSISARTSETVYGALTAAALPVFRIRMIAGTAQIASSGEIYLGDVSWQLPRHPLRPFDPYFRTQDGGLRRFKISLKGLDPSLRSGIIEDLFDAAQDLEAIWTKWNTDAPILTEAEKDDREASFDPHRIRTTINLIERL